MGTAKIATVIISLQFAITGWAQVDHSPLRERIPKPDPAKYSKVREGKDWKNPFLVVRPNGIEINGVTPRAGYISLQDVTKELEHLPSSAWPYGLVVAVVDAGIVSGGDDLPKIRRIVRSYLRS